MNGKEDANKSLDKIISTAQDMKRKLSLLSDKQCSKVIHQVSHEIIDEKMNRIKKDLELFIRMNSIIGDFLKVTNVSEDRFFKKENLRKKKKPAHDSAKDDVIDARRVFCNIFKDVKDDTLGRYLGLSRFTIAIHKKRGDNFLETDKKFQEYYANVIKKLNLGAQ